MEIIRAEKREKEREKVRKVRSKRDVEERKRFCQKWMAE